MDIVERIQSDIAESTKLSCIHLRQGDHWNHGYMLSEFICPNCSHVHNGNSGHLEIRSIPHIPSMSIRDKRIMIDKYSMSTYSCRLLNIDSVQEVAYHCGDRLISLHKRNKRLKDTLAPEHLASIVPSISSFIKLLKAKKAIVSCDNVNDTFSIIDTDEGYLLTLRPLQSCLIHHGDNIIQSRLHMVITRIVDKGNYQKLYASCTSRDVEYNESYHDLLFYQVIISLCNDTIGYEAFFNDKYCRGLWNRMWKNPEISQSIMFDSGTSYSKLMSLLGQMDIRTNIVDTIDM